MIANMDIERTVIISRRIVRYRDIATQTEATKTIVKKSKPWYDSWNCMKRFHVRKIS